MKKYAHGYVSFVVDALRSTNQCVEKLGILHMEFLGIRICANWVQNNNFEKSHRRILKCNLCKRLSFAQREWWDSKHFNHIAETKKERAQYYKTKIKAIQKCLVILLVIIDVTAKNKTKIPYFDRPDKCIASEQGLKTKLFAAIVHGFGVYLFWCTALIQTGSNLTIEVLRRTLNKIEAEQGFLPPILHLQLDNASDNKSKQFLAFITYLVENRVFNVVKLSYLIVAHTHADVDQYLSCCSRFFRRIMQTIFSVCLTASATRPRKYAKGSNFQSAVWYRIGCWL